MEITPRQFPTAALPIGAEANSGQNRDIARATKILNQEGVAGPGREFSFSVDPKTKLAIVRIVDASTGELIDQLPSDSILQVAQQIDELRSTNRKSVR
jgi:flagellar protein FlaG